MSWDEFQRLQKPSKRVKLGVGSKYGAKPEIGVDGKRKPSKLERETHALFSLWERMKPPLVRNLKWNPGTVELRHPDGGLVRYKPDGYCEEFESGVWVETWLEPHGIPADYRFRRVIKAWQASGPGRLKIFKGKYEKGRCTPFLERVIEPG